MAPPRRPTSGRTSAARAGSARPPARLSADRGPVSPGRSHRLLPVGCSAVLALVILRSVGRDDPFVGHDYAYYIPRLLDTLIHLQINGPLAVQWYTPTFGGGLPAFPNPQHLQHSLLQALTFFFDPWTAVMLTTGVVSVVGFLAFVRFCERELQLQREASCLGAVFFIGNGFYIEHLIAGHVGFQLFPLIAVLLDVLVDARRSVVSRAGIAGLVVAAMLYQAGAYLVVLSAMTLTLVLPLIEVLAPGVLRLQQTVTIASLGALIAVSIGAARLHATYSFMRFFPREIDERYSASLPEALAGFAAQLTGVMTFAPLLAIAGIAQSRIADGLSRLTGSPEFIGLWELDTGLSPIAWGLLVVGTAVATSSCRRSGIPSLDRRTWVACIAVAVMTWLLIEATLARGLVYPLLKPLPILRSLHVNPRIASTFILPLALIAATIVQRRFGEARQASIRALLVLLALLAPLSYLLLPASLHGRSFDLTLARETYTRARAGESFTVDRVAAVDDMTALASGASSQRPYEPLFGYMLEEFASELLPGDVHDVRAGAFNLSNPAGYVFPEENDSHPFARIVESDRESLDLFVARASTDWTLPTTQVWANRLSTAALIAALFAALTGARRRRPSRPQKRPGVKDSL